MSRKSRSGAGAGQGVWGRGNGGGDGFTCIKCGAAVNPQLYGSKHRNHCPYCLWSRHVDDEPGDRRCACAQPMEPIALEVRRDGEWAIVHRCTGCGMIKTNRIAGDDDVGALLGLALKPIANAPFPLDALSGWLPG